MRGDRRHNHREAEAVPAGPQAGSEIPLPSLLTRKNKLTLCKCPSHCDGIYHIHIYHKKDEMAA